MVEIPTKEEIEQLPRWARVAFAARCARRVQPLYVIAWPDAHKNHIRDIDAAITLAEEAAENAVKNAKISLAAAGNAADSAGYVGDDIDAYHAVGYTAVRAATYAAATAAFAADSANPVEDGRQMPRLDGGSVASSGIGSGCCAAADLCRLDLRSVRELLELR